MLEFINLITFNFLALTVQKHKSATILLQAPEDSSISGSIS